MLYAQRRDGNEKEIVNALRHVGAWVGYMDKSAGFDLLVAFCGRYFAIEVKQKGEPLTPREKKIAEQLIFQKAPYYVVHTIDEALDAIGAIW